MGDDLSLNESVFHFRGSNIEIPIFCGDGKLSFCFVEVGCRPNGKKSQLRNDKELLMKYWADNYSFAGFMPKIYRFMVHYSPEEIFLDRSRVYGIDANIRYNHVPLSFLEGMNKFERERMFKPVKRSKKAREDLEKILEEKDYLALHALIVEGKNLIYLANLRGAIAEILAQHDISEQSPEGLEFQRNGFLKYFNKRYSNGTEIDGVLTFYEEENLVELARRLRRLPHIDILDIWNDNLPQ